MQINIPVRGHYEWAPAPEGVPVTEQDIATGRVRPNSSGAGYNMRVNRAKDETVHVTLGEGEIVQTIIRAYTEHGKCGAILTRAEAVARNLATVVMPLHAHPKWFKRIHVHDDAGPDEKFFRASLAPYLEADHGRAPGKSVDADDVEEMVAAYMMPMPAGDHAAHLHKHFKIKPSADAAPAAELSK